jgi:hypothetical protein
MRVRGWTITIVVLGTLVTLDRTAAWAQVGVAQSNQKKTIACGGQEAAVTGSLNDIIFTGECPSVTIKGSENTIAIEATGAIRVVGTKNKVTWQRDVGDDIKTPKISRSGLGNVISQAAAPARESAAPAASPGTGTGSGVGTGTAKAASGAAAGAGAAKSAGSGATSSSAKAGTAAKAGGGAAAAGPAVVVADEKATRSIDCRGRGVTVQGNGNTLTLRGTCGKLDVQGNENIISVDTVHAVSTTGNKNRVTWTRAADGETPDTSDLGNGNVIRRGTAPTP